MHAKLDPRIAAAQRRRAEAEAELRKAQEQETQLLASGLLKHDARAQTIIRRLTALREELHQTRLKISRKKFSVRKRQAFVDRVKEAITKLEQVEVEKVTEQQKCERDLAAIRATLAQQARQPRAGGTHTP